MEVNRLAVVVTRVVEQLCDKRPMSSPVRSLDPKNAIDTAVIDAAAFTTASSIGLYYQWWIEIARALAVIQAGGGSLLSKWGPMNRRPCRSPSSSTL